MPLEINIPSTSIANPPTSSKPYTVYNVAMHHPIRTVVLPKRYSDFVNLQAALIAEITSNDTANTDAASIKSTNTSTSGKITSKKPALPRSLPPKSWLTRTVGNPTLTEKRRAALEEYLRAIETHGDARWRKCMAWRKFLELPASYRPEEGNDDKDDGVENNSLGALNGGVGNRGYIFGDVNGSATRSMLANLTTQAASPTGWLDVHAELKSQLQAGRSALSRREQLLQHQQFSHHSSKSTISRSSTSSTTAFTPSTYSSSSSSLSSNTSNATITQETATVHEVATMAKKSLIRAGTLIAALDAGLRRHDGSAEGGNKRGSKSSGLGPGEIRRRRDMLRAARTERSGLEALLQSNNASSSSEGVNSTANDNASPTTTDQNSRPSLFTTSSNKPQIAATTKSRRTLGGPSLAPAKETAATRPLDNAAVLQLQRDTMAAQDHDVGILTESVRRIKGMGELIGEEVALQTEMLGLVSGDVDRVEGKVGVAKGRVGKLK